MARRPLLPDNSPLPPWAASLPPLAEAMVRLFQPHLEVVLHDLSENRILALWGMHSGRTQGDPSLLSELPETPSGTYVVGPYEKRSPGGSRIVSTSAVVRDGKGLPAGLLCLNFDRSLMDRVGQLLQGFAAPTEARPPELFEHDWREQIALAITDCCSANAFDRAHLSRAQREVVVGHLEARGLFATRHAVDHVATCLGISRALVYQLRKPRHGA